MKQVLITRSQLDQIIAVENGKLSAKVAIEQDDFKLGLWLTNYVCDLSDNILKRLFGELSNDEAAIEEVKCREALSSLKELLREWGEDDE